MIGNEISVQRVEYRLCCNAITLIMSVAAEVGMSGVFVALVHVSNSSHLGES